MAGQTPELTNLIIVNGTSCAGKTSVCQFIAGNLRKDFCHVSWDDFRDATLFNPEIPAPEKTDLVGLFTKNVNERLSSGENLMLDIVCIPTMTFKRAMDDFNSYASLTVRMRAAPEILLAREALRPDRKNGQAIAQHEQLYGTESHPAYDLELDTTDRTISELADEIVRRL